MTSKADFKQLWESESPESRRMRLNELGAMPERTDDQEREHDQLAEMVAQDEDDAATKEVEPIEEV